MTEHDLTAAATHTHGSMSTSKQACFTMFHQSFQSAIYKYHYLETMPSGTHNHTMPGSGTTAQTRFN